MHDWRRLLMEWGFRITEVSMRSKSYSNDQRGPWLRWKEGAGWKGGLVWEVKNEG